MSEEEYRRSQQKYQGGVQALRWHSYRSAAARYREVVADLDFEGRSILDVGCGYGNLIPYITAKATDFTYTGIDLMEEFTEEAARRYPDHTFVTGDYFQQPLPDKFDLIVCCGALNTNRTDIQELRREVTTTMWDHATEAVCFNMSGHYPLLKSDKMIDYADPREWLEFGFTLTDRVILRHHYHPKDFTLVLYRPL